MPDMLVKLYNLPPLEPLIARQSQQGVTLRRALAPEKHIVIDWVGRNFWPSWRNECDLAFARQPISCWLATSDERLVGFGCYDATYRNFFGPTGVDQSQRGRGIGEALLLACLHDMAAHGYAYAIIGQAGPVDFYTAKVGASAIPDSEPGPYRGLLHDEPQVRKSED